MERCTERFEFKLTPTESRKLKREAKKKGVPRGYLLRQWIRRQGK